MAYRVSVEVEEEDLVRMFLNSFEVPSDVQVVDVEVEKSSEVDVSLVFSFLSNSEDAESE